MFVFGGNNGSIRDDYKINNSLRFRSSASAYLNRTFGTPTNQKIGTFSYWFKRGDLSATYVMMLGSRNTTTGNGPYLGFQNDTIRFVDSDGSAGTGNMITTQVFRDPSAWYHIVLSIDTTQATDSNRFKLYVNGIQITAFGTASYPSLNRNMSIFASGTQYIGYSTGSNFCDGYLAEINFIDGQALTPSSFGYTHPKTGVWRPKPYTGTYGTNGFYLKFSDIATTSGSNAGLGKDFSGNGNYWTTNNISVTSGTTYDAMIDSPTLGGTATQPASNYCVLNPVFVGTATSATPINANMTLNAGDKYAIGTIMVQSGKWYAEATVTTVGAYTAVGITGTLITANSYPGHTSGDNGYSWSFDGFLHPSNAAASSTYTTGDVIGMAWDASAGTLQFYKNNVAGSLISGITSGIDRSWSINGRTTGGANNVTLNCGQQPFKYTPPSGFKALCTSNLPNVTVPKGNKYMDATLYTGTGASQSITNASSFKPDFVWAKGRSGATDHALYDSVRGTTKQLESNTTTAETTESTGLTAFNSDGFTVGALAQMNTNTATYVGWQWQAGQGTTSSNTSGSITSTVSANTTAGFSVVTYTGTGANATVGHGLGVAPKMVIVKNRTTATYTNWAVYHTSLGGTKGIFLNLTNAATTSSTIWNNTDPTSSVFSVGNGGVGGNTNENTVTYVAYCFAEIADFSKFGSYTGNGSTNGPFVYLGFRPKFVMFKRTDSSTFADWTILDSVRDTYNEERLVLDPNTSAAEATGSSGVYRADFLSNGFKIRGTSASFNASSATYIYMAFAETPTKFALAR